MKHCDGPFMLSLEVGDRVIVERTIGGGWFDIGPTNSNASVVKRIERGGCRHTAIHEIRYSPDWGTASCYSRMLKPHAETLAAARVAPSASTILTEGREVARATGSFNIQSADEIEGVGAASMGGGK